MNTAASSFASSFLMASHLSGEKRRSRCFFGVALGSTFRVCSINSLGTPGISAGFHANVSVGPKEVDELEFLFVAQASSNDGGFGVICLL